MLPPFVFVATVACYSGSIVSCYVVAHESRNSASALVILATWGTKSFLAGVN